jgi:4-hydroxy-2-oxoheptanedioate aldolase
MVETATQASDLVKAMRYPPRGIRGVATARASRWCRVDDYWAGADDQTCLVVQIETMRGLENIGEIVAVDGVDAVFIGPSDLGASLGHLGDPGHQAVSHAVSSALRAVRRLGKPAGVLSSDPMLTHQYLAAGARFVAVAVDTVLLANTLSNVARDARATAVSANAEPI